MAGSPLVLIESPEKQLGPLGARQLKCRGGNVSWTIWDGIRYNEGDIGQVVADANTTTVGQGND